MAGSSRSGGDRKSVGHDSSKPDGGPLRPKGRGSEFNHKWDELLSQLDPNSLRRIDSHQLSILSELLIHSDSLAKLLRTDPLDEKSRRFFLQTSMQISRLSSQFGLSPSDRQKLKLEPEVPMDDFQNWQNGVEQT